jgi:hypothetical protein
VTRRKTCVVPLWFLLCLYFSRRLIIFNRRNRSTMRTFKLTSVFVCITILFLSVACNKDREALAITASPTNPTTATSVRFQSSQDGSGWRFSWNFGDGNNNTTNTSYADHTYSQPGNYNVTLSVDHNGTQMGTCNTSITVQ